MSCITVCVFVVGKSKLYDFGWWSACVPDEIPDAIQRAIGTFNSYLLDTENPKVLATRTEIFHKMLDVYDRITEDVNLGMGYPDLGVRGRVKLETVENTMAYMVLLK